MVVTNGLVFTEDCAFARRDLAFEGDRITQIAPAGSLPAGQAINAAGGLVLPGLVDIHTHGAVDADFSDSDAEGIPRMLDYYAQQGVTSVLGTVLALDKKKMAAALKAAKPLVGAGEHGAVLRGMRLEGPFLSAKRPGAQDPGFFRAPSIALFDELFEQADGNVRFVDVAPELPGVLDFIRAVCRRCPVSLGHSDASYNESASAFTAGAGHVTHLFNAMRPFGQRDPGLVGAAGDLATSAEVISDGEHLHPAVVRAAFALLGEERMCLVSDSMRAAGMPEGNYTLGEMDVVVEGGRATLYDGTIAGSVASLAECCRRAVGFGVPLERAIRAATLNPARAAGLDREVGSLMPGKRADILVWDREMNTRCIIAGGRVLQLEDAPA